MNGRLAATVGICVMASWGWNDDVRASDAFVCQCRAKVCRCEPRVTRQGSVETAVSRRFLVRSERPDVSAPALARLCEVLYAELGEFWVGASRPLTDWSAPCEVRVYADRVAYERAVGVGSGSTSGSTLLRRERGQIVLRRIDLRGDVRDWKESALPHELTHLLFADRFPGRPLIRWLDEGIATQVEPLEKRERRRQELLLALQRGQHFALATLTALEAQPEAQRRGAFYAQSTALVEFLVQQKTPEEFLRFVDIAQERGQTAALAEVYGWRNWGEVDAAALRHAQRERTADAPRLLVEQLLAAAGLQHDE